MKYNLMLLVVTTVAQAPGGYGRILSSLARVAARPVSSISNEEDTIMISSHVIQGRETEGLLLTRRPLENPHRVKAKTGFFNGERANTKKVVGAEEEPFKEFMLRMSRMKQSNDLFSDGVQREQQGVKAKTWGPSAVVLEPPAVANTEGETQGSKAGATKKFLIKKYGAQWKRKWESPKGNNFNDE